MPAAIPAEIKEKVKVIAVQIGVREAARAFEIPEGTVQYWSANEGWMAQKQQAQELTEKKLEKIGLQPASTKSPSDVMLEVGSKSKLVLAKTVHKTAKQLHKAKNEQLVLQTQALKATVDAGAKLHGWDTPSPSLTQINVNLTGAQLPDRSKGQ